MDEQVLVDMRARLAALIKAKGAEAVPVLYKPRSIVSVPAIYHLHEKPEWVEKSDDELLTEALNIIQNSVETIEMTDFVSYIAIGGHRVTWGCGDNGYANTLWVSLDQYGHEWRNLSHLRSQAEQMLDRQAVLDELGNIAPTG